MKNNFSTSPIAAAVFLLLQYGTISYAAPLSLVQYPPGSMVMEPAPNVIISVDDSGSMGDDGIASLRNALQETFTAENIPNNSIRLAWQSMNRCNGIPSSAAGCDGKNGMHVLNDAHRTNFTNWVKGLVQGGGTPSHTMVRNAGDYLKRTDLGVNSPWAEIPGEKSGNILACRKSFHVFMTDGSWNSSTNNTSTHIDADRNIDRYSTILPDRNIDASITTLPDGEIYNPTSDTSIPKIYADKWGGPFNQPGNKNPQNINTLSDLAFYYWSTDLQPDIPNQIKPKTNQSENESIKKGGKELIVTPYWNPKNNPANWQNLTTYSIGFKSATDWGKDPEITWNGNMYGGDYLDLMIGNKSWPTPLCKKYGFDKNGDQACDTADGYNAQTNNRKIELWHMAINGRGKFFPAATGAELTAAFKEIMRDVGGSASSSIASFASSSKNNQRSDIGVFTTSFKSDGWVGAVSAAKLKANSNVIDTTEKVWSGGSSAEILDAMTSINLGNRLILTATDTTREGISFDWSPDGTTSLTDSQKLLLQGVPGTEDDGKSLVAYIRGDLTNDGTKYRKRKSRQGDIVNSKLWYVARPSATYGYAGYSDFVKEMKNRTPMLYVGGNDGMLHGFSAVDGKEKIAYVPKGVIANLKNYASTNYSHQYFVDGSPFTGDVNIKSSGTPDWRTMLVGTLGAGGRGYFVLDVTKPGSTDSSVSDNMTLSNAKNLVIADQTYAASDTSANPDVGHIFAPPVVDASNTDVVTQITKMNNGRWAAIIGNGYNSINERPALLIQYLDGDKELLTVGVTDPSAKGGNGLSAPRVFDVNGDGTPDMVYAGDIQGNLWKFDLSSNNSNNWKVAFNGKPFYTAKNYVKSGGKVNSTTPQPITTAPLIKALTSPRGVMVAFGSGKNITEADRTSKNIEAIYSILDKTIYKKDSTGKLIDVITPNNPPAEGLDNLVEQNSVNYFSGESNSAGWEFWELSSNDVDYSAGKEGWYMKLPAGERVLKNLEFYDNTRILQILTEVPASGGNSSSSEESCDPPSIPSKQYMAFMSITSGKNPTYQILDANGDGLYDKVKDGNATKVGVAPGEVHVISGKDQNNVVSEKNMPALAPAPIQTLRPSWRQMQ